MTPRGLSRRALLGGTVALATAAALPAAAAPGGHAPRPRGVELDTLLGLTTQAGTPLERRALRGHPFIVVFGYTRCPEVCPTTMHELSQHLASLGADADRLGVFFVTVDPERDTVDTLQRYLTAFDPRIVGLTGPVDKVRAVADAFGAPFDKSPSTQAAGDYSMRHSYLLYLVDRYGLLATTVDYGAPASTLTDLSQRLLRQ